MRCGYDALSYRYRADDDGEGRYAPWLAGLEITAHSFVPEGDGGHALFWARRPPAASG